MNYSYTTTATDNNFRVVQNHGQRKKMFRCAFSKYSKKGGKQIVAKKSETHHRIHPPWALSLTRFESLRRVAPASMSKENAADRRK